MSDKLGNHNASKSDNFNGHETSFSETDNNYWAPGTVALVGDPIVNGTEEKRLSINNFNVKVFYFSRARIKKKPEFLFLHVGTNDATTNDSRKVVDDILLLNQKH